MTKDYNCPRCGFVTNRICNLKTHLQRKNQCRDILGCGLTALDIIKKLLSDDHLGDELTRLKAENAHLLDENAKLHKEIEALRKTLLSVKDNPQITINNVTIHQNNNVTIIVNDFGKEETSHIEEDGQFLDECLKKLHTSAIESMVEKVYFDGDHPENHTILMKNVKMNQVMIRENGKWKRVNGHTPAVNMMKKSKRILHSYYNDKVRMYDECENIMEDGRIMYFDKLMNPNTNEHKIAISKIKGIISNHRFGDYIK